MSQPETITHVKLAKISGYTVRQIQRLTEQGILPEAKRGVVNRDDVETALFQHLRVKPDASGNLTDEKLGLVREQRQKLERERLMDEGETIGVTEHLELLRSTIPPIKANLRTLLITEIPATCSGRNESEIRGLMQKRFPAFCRDMQRTPIGKKLEELEPAA